MPINCRLKSQLDYTSQSIRKYTLKEKNSRDVLIKSCNHGRKNMQPIGIMDGIKNWNKELESFPPLYMNIYQSNTYRKDLE